MTARMGDIEGQRRASNESALGSREHIQQTLEYSREAITAARRVRVGSVLPDRVAEHADGPSTGPHATTALRAQLHASVTAYVRRLRDDGVTPEQTLVHVKTVVREATPIELAVPEARQLLEEVVNWTVTAYFESHRTA